MLTPALLYLILALALIAGELIIMQLSVLWFLLFGLGALVTSIICWALPELSWAASTGVFITSSVGISVLLYPILKKWQKAPAPIAGNDAIGQIAKVVEEITPSKNGKVFWSGTEWTAQLFDGESTVTVGESVIIKKIKGIRLIVGR